MPSLLTLLSYFHHDLQCVDPSSGKAALPLIMALHDREAMVRDTGAAPETHANTTDKRHTRCLSSSTTCRGGRSATGNKQPSLSYRRWKPYQTSSAPAAAVLPTKSNTRMHFLAGMQPSATLRRRASYCSIGSSTDVGCGPAPAACSSPASIGSGAAAPASVSMASPASSGFASAFFSSCSTFFSQEQNTRSAAPYTRQHLRKTWRASRQVAPPCAGEQHTVVGLSLCPLTDQQLCVALQHMVQ